MSMLKRLFDFHQHHWKAVSVRHYQVSTTVYFRKSGTSKETPVGECTIVLEACACGTHRTRELEGLWSLGDLQC